MLLQFFKGHVFTHGGIGMDLYPVSFEIINLCIQHRPRQSVFGNSVSHHPAGFGHGLVYIHLIPVKCQKICRSKPGRT